MTVTLIYLTKELCKNPKGLITVQICSFSTWHLEYRSGTMHRAVTDSCSPKEGCPSGNIFRQNTDGHSSANWEFRPFIVNMSSLVCYGKSIFMKVRHMSPKCTKVPNTRQFRLSKARYYFPAFGVKMFIHLPGEVKLLEAAQCRTVVKEWLRNSVKNCFESSYPPPLKYF